MYHFPEPLNKEQRKDAQGLVFPWLTEPFLELLKNWDLRNWDCFEWGAGYSTIWFSKHANSITSIESREPWAIAVQEHIDRLQLTNSTLKYRIALTNPDRNSSPFSHAIDEDDKLYDLILIDGAQRNWCAERALNHIKSGGIIILDNADQRSLGIKSQPTFELMKKYEQHVYAQPDNPDWKTVYWVIK
jgi:predicted O-methyltransferase YrrM